MPQHPSDAPSRTGISYRVDRPAVDVAAIERLLPLAEVGVRTNTSERFARRLIAIGQLKHSRPREPQEGDRSGS